MSSNKASLVPVRDALPKHPPLDVSAATGRTRLGLPHSERNPGLLHFDKHLLPKQLGAIQLERNKLSSRRLNALVLLRKLNKVIVLPRGKL